MIMLGNGIKCINNYSNNMGVFKKILMVLCGNLSDWIYMAKNHKIEYPRTMEEEDFLNIMDNIENDDYFDDN